MRFSARELEILALMAEGHTSCKAADHLFVSKRTIEFHLASVYSKLQVRNRIQAIAAARRMGLIPSYGGPVAEEMRQEM